MFMWYGCKRTIVLEVEDRVSVCLVIIIIIRLYIAINDLHRDINNIQAINLISMLYPYHRRI